MRIGSADFIGWSCRLIAGPGLARGRSAVSPHTTHGCWVADTTTMGRAESGGGRRSLKAHRALLVLYRRRQWRRLRLQPKRNSAIPISSAMRLAAPRFRGGRRRLVARAQRLCRGCAQTRGHCGGREFRPCPQAAPGDQGGRPSSGGSNAPNSLLVWTRRCMRRRARGFEPEGSREPRRCRPLLSRRGAMWVDAYEAVTTRRDRYVQGGGCTTVGVAGLVQGGGSGSFSKGYGSAAASLLEARDRHRRRQSSRRQCRSRKPTCSGG